MSRRVRLLTLVAMMFGLLGLLSGGALAKTTLSWWTGTLPEQVARSVIDEFQQEHPDIEIEVSFQPWNGLREKYLVALQGPTPPDIVYLPNPWNLPFAGMGLLGPIDEYIDDDFKNRFYPANWQTTLYQGKSYGVPARTDVLSVFYNRDLFAAAGLPDRAPDTWDELLSFAQKTTVDVTGDGILDQYGYGSVGNNFSNVVYRVFPFIWQNRGSVLNEAQTESLIHEEAAVEGVQFYTDLFTKYGVTQLTTMSDSAQETDRLFLNGKVAMTYTGPWLISTLNEQAPDLNYATSVYPRKAPYNDRSAGLGGWNFAISSRTRYPQEAMMFLEFLSNPEINARITTSLPAVVGADADPRYQDPGYDGFKEQLNHMRMMPTVPQSTEIQQIVYEEVQQVMFERKSAQEAMNDATQRINRILNR